jgi:hypothetical protein
MKAVSDKAREPMTREQWEAQPEVFRYFHPWERARKPLTKERKPVTNFARMIRSANLRNTAA